MDKKDFFKFLIINYTISIFLVFIISILILFNTDYTLFKIITTNLLWVLFFLSIGINNDIFLNIINLILLLWIYLFLYNIWYKKFSYFLSFIFFILFIIMWDLARNITV